MSERLRESEKRQVSRATCSAMSLPRSRSAQIEIQIEISAGHSG